MLSDAVGVGVIEIGGTGPDGAGCNANSPSPSSPATVFLQSMLASLNVRDPNWDLTWSPHLLLERPQRRLGREAETDAAGGGALAVTSTPVGATSRVALPSYHVRGRRAGVSG